MKRHGCDISPGTIYALLQRMEQYVWLRSKQDPKAGPRPGLTTTLWRRAERFLGRVRDPMEEMVKEVVLEVRGETR